MVLDRWNMENSVLVCLCIQILCAIFTHGETLQTKDQQFIDSLQQYEFIEPMFSEPVKDEIDANYITAEEKKVLSFRFQGQIIKLLLTLKRNLFSPNFFERYVTKDGYEIVNEVPRNCYYHGHVDGHKDTIVALSTCHGIEGYFTLNDKTFSIHPVETLEGEKLHIAFETDDLELPKYTCDHHRENVSRDTYERSISVERHRVRRDVLSETKYVELVIINDLSQYQRRGSETSTRAIKMANFADSTYRVQNIRVVLVMIETWKHADQIASSSDNDQFLANFVAYKDKVLDKNETTQSDHAVLVTQKKLQNDRHGWAVIQGICSPSSASLLYDAYDSTNLAGSVIAHELGHSFGFTHISSTCSCDAEPSKCLMNADVSYGPLKWSNCTKAKLKDVLLRDYGTCLFNLPTEHYITPKCQNGLVDPGEECDCGTKEECERKPYHCCNYTTCKLHHGNECDSGMCCDNCTINAKGSLCRDKVNDCDLPEYCDGKHSMCPPDMYVHNGRSCSDVNDTSLCYFGVCHTHNKQCEAYWGSDGFFSERCHKKINILKNTKYGFCKLLGENQYVKCAKSDALCGKLQCEMKNEFEDRTTLDGNAAIYIQGKSWSHKCWSGELDHRVPHIGMVETGTMCGENKVCFNNTCIDIKEAYADQPECPNNCSGNGICNNLGHCHCNPGYSCPNCSERCNSTGGSIDSGNDCYCPVATTTESTQQSTSSMTEEAKTTSAGNENGETSTSQTIETTHKTTGETRERSSSTKKAAEGTKAKKETADSESQKQSQDDVLIIVPTVIGGCIVLSFLLIILIRQKRKKLQKSRSNPGDPRVVFSQCELDAGESFSQHNIIDQGKESGDKNIQFTSLSIMPESKIGSTNTGSSVS
ncbi:disintegrin and metalloproteinase domain-containing protein 9-like isoform X2 [Dendronephthya gigantea]|uniref:disintegrin and metalloproteinase domain-containing protein 9-like isoform X2 n=1 Tax=Dendronephthya gigantea TaxID=151771 RepID=UPI00106CC398|nr:disintegrin and metalloproteinase domain-containing protein 9-like isoform X2 [Dendronephthya gigantea]